MSNTPGTSRRTQAERRAETREILLGSACILFGERGFKDTSLNDIAESVELTIRPIYYHFGSKRGLFQAVNQVMEQRAIQVLSSQTSQKAWESLLALCRNSAFTRVIFEDAPNVLGRERWLTAQRLTWARSLALPTCEVAPPLRFPAELRDRTALAVLLEAALYVLECSGDKAIEQEAMQLISTLLPDEASVVEAADCTISPGTDTHSTGSPESITLNKKERMNAI